MLSFKSYALVSTLLTVASLTYAYHTRHQFYPSVLFLTSHKVNLVILGNLAFFSLLCVGQMIKLIFLGQLTRDEVEELVTSSKYAITETCLALTIFREELNMKVMGLFAALLAVKIFHWMSSMRVEHIARSTGLPISTHIRLTSLLFFLISLDITCIYFLFTTLNANRTASVLFLFAFEYTILAVASLATLIKYGIYLIDLRLEGRWQAKSLLLFYLDLTSDLLRLVLYLCFFGVICVFYGLPLHLIRELCVTFYNLRERLSKFIHYRRITANMNERFADATPAELQAGDRTCIVCREDMDSAKKLSCGHCFHFHCLRSWLERSQSCPTCRANIEPLGTPATAANAAAAPLPPHIQAQLDQINATRAANGLPAQTAVEAGLQPAAAGTPAAASPPPSAGVAPYMLSFFSLFARREQNPPAEAAPSSSANAPSAAAAAVPPAAATAEPAATAVPSPAPAPVPAPAPPSLAFPFPFFSNRQQPPQHNGNLSATAAASTFPPPFLSFLSAPSQQQHQQHQQQQPSQQQQSQQHHTPTPSYFFPPPISGTGGPPAYSPTHHNPAQSLFTFPLSSTSSPPPLPPFPFYLPALPPATAEQALHAHCALLLQHQMERLESELRYVKMIWKREVEMQAALIEKERDKEREREKERENEKDKEKEKARERASGSEGWGGKGEEEKKKQ